MLQIISESILESICNSVNEYTSILCPVVGELYSDILYMHRLGRFFAVQNFEFRLLFLWGGRVFQKNEYFYLDMKICTYFRRVTTKLDSIFGVFKIVY